MRKPARALAGPATTATSMTMRRVTTMPSIPMSAAKTVITIAATGTRTIMDIDAEAGAGAQLPLMIWLSPAFPVGAFAYSHGLEWAVEAGDVADARSLETWLIDLLQCGAPRADAILFAVAFRLAAAADWPALLEANELAVALATSAERRLETTAQGTAFVAAARAAWDCEPLR